MPGKIFVSYRRDDDPNAAARIRDALTAKFGRSSVFMDVDDLLAGLRFDEELAKALAACDVFLAIIGPRSAPFAVGKFAVTVDEWDACVANGGCNGYNTNDTAWGRGKHPAINVSWFDAKAYAAWLLRKTGKTYRLLSEAEREYVTRAGTATPFWWGSSITPYQANYDGNYTYAGGGSNGEFRRQTVQVDSFKANAWGLYNVHGNVWEWTEDCWNGSNMGNPGDSRARTTGNCSQRVVRGGSWNDIPHYLRSARRLGGGADNRISSRGFRMAKMLNP